MKHQGLDEIRTRALVQSSQPKARPLSKVERLERWAAALEREGDKQLNTLFEIEHMPRAKRRAMRADNSLLSVAYADPVLRADGLAGDAVGDVLTYFRIKERELHDVACYCNNGPSRSGWSAAARVRGLATRPPADVRPLIAAAGVALSLVAAVVLL
ncbi:hypothetical protein [Dongia deserti]|uniref:hypothetical protein n=1 Tax=Dongia deserti TaxID=2268030 RepID=UPI000E65B275|nr:hypothetical protein [Dongia deserti]